MLQNSAQFLQAFLFAKKDDGKHVDNIRSE
jgi:hypothetical protein